MRETVAHVTKQAGLYTPRGAGFPRTAYLHSNHQLNGTPFTSHFSLGLLGQCYPYRVEIKDYAEQSICHGIGFIALELDKLNMDKYKITKAVAHKSSHSRLCIALHSP